VRRRILASFVNNRGLSLAKDRGHTRFRPRLPLGLEGWPPRQSEVREPAARLERIGFRGNPAPCQIQ